jgi:hypothetical protein
MNGMSRTLVIAIGSVLVGFGLLTQIRGFSLSGAIVGVVGLGLLIWAMRTKPTT